MDSSRKAHIHEHIGSAAAAAAGRVKDYTAMMQVIIHIILQMLCMYLFCILCTHYA